MCIQDDKYVCKVSLWNSKRLLRKLQNKSYSILRCCTVFIIFWTFFREHETNICPGHFVSGYTTAEMTLDYTQLVLQPWALVGTMQHQLICKNTSLQLYNVIKLYTCGGQHLLECIANNSPSQRYAKCYAVLASFDKVIDEIERVCSLWLRVYIYTGYRRFASNGRINW